MDDITVGQIIAVLSGCLGLYAAIVEGKRILNKRAEEVNDRVTKLEKHYDQEIKAIKEDMVRSVEHKKLYSVMKMILKTQFTQIQHTITGNHIEQMIQLKDDLNEFIINEMG